MAKKHLTDRERFQHSFTIDRNECWIWQKAKDKDGYGLFKVSPKMVRAARWAFSQFKREIPNGLQIDHLCRNRSCVNPDHLEIVTHAENRFRARWEFCGKGHKMTDDNIWLDSRGYRYCRACRVEYTRNYRRNMPGGWNNYVRRKERERERIGSR